MKIFLTGATGFIGSRIIPELLGAGHTVLGLTRSDDGVQQLESAGVEPYRGNLEDPDGLKDGAASADAVIHCGFDHDFTRSANAFAENTEKDRRVITAFADVLAGTDKPLVITSGVGMGSKGPGEPGVEDYFDANNPNPRKATEEAGNAAIQLGVNVSVVRLPQVHDAYKQGLLTYYTANAKQKGVAAYVGDGANRWAAAPVDDVARLYRLVVERGERGSRWNAVQEEGVALKAIAEVVAEVLQVKAVSVPREQAGEAFGFLGWFMGENITATSEYTRRTLGWDPIGPTLLEDLQQGKF